MFRLTVLIENFSYCGLPCEHGLSLYLEYRGRAWLLDTGTSGAFTANADALGLDLARVEGVVLSHGHDDHAGGLPAFFARNRRAKVYARPFAREEYRRDTADPEKRPAGVDPALFSAWADRFDLSDGPRTLAPGLHLLPDTVPHEQSLVAETAEGLVVLNSCCHAGAGEIVAGVLERFPGQQVAALVGGFHLVGPIRHGFPGPGPGGGPRPGPPARRPPGSKGRPHRPLYRPARLLPPGGSRPGTLFPPDHRHRSGVGRPVAGLALSPAPCPVGGDFFALSISSACSHLIYNRPIDNCGAGWYSIISTQGYRVLRFQRGDGYGTERTKKAHPPCHH